MTQAGTLLCRTGINLWPFIYIVSIFAFILFTIISNVNSLLLIALIASLLMIFLFLTAHYLVNFCVFWSNRIEIIYPLRFKRRINRVEYNEIISASFWNTTSRHTQPTLTIKLKGQSLSFPVESKKRRKKVFDALRRKDIKLSIDSVLESDYNL